MKRVKIVKLHLNILTSSLFERINLSNPNIGLYKYNNTIKIQQIIINNPSNLKLNQHKNIKPNLINIIILNSYLLVLIPYPGSKIFQNN